MTTNTIEHPAGLLVDVPAVRTALGDAPFKIANGLVGHPLFEPERIKRLLRRIPRHRVEIRAVESRNTADGTYRRGERLTDVDPVEAFSRLEERPTWMLLHESWLHDPEYAELLRQYLDGLSARFPEMRPDVSQIGCWMFLSSGGIVVHFHADSDQSFLNQVRGSKTVYVYPARMLPETTIETLAFTNNQGAVAYRPEYEDRVFPPVHLSPGESVFLPLYAPHRVVNDDSISISWNVGFHTRASQARHRTHLVNVELRALGLSPAPYGTHPASDWVKARLQPACHIKNRVLPRLKPRVRL